MHTYACQYDIMRTTIELKPEHRRALLALTARRGKKSLSTLVTEAIEEYLNAEGMRINEPHALLSLAGTLSASEADRLRQSTKRLRKR